MHETTKGKRVFEEISKRMGHELVDPLLHTIYCSGGGQHD